ncbi:MAG: tetratricopeptide repeat protein [Deltaproteobacteria bacterium]|nr:tetratricopeptide repeat protein [Deltaproteobacteria bacterium]
MAKKVPIKTLLRTNDAFLTTSEKIYNYYLTNTKKIWLIAASVVGVFLIAIMVKNFYEARQEKAVNAYHQALAQTDPGLVVSQLNKVRTDYSGTAGARQATYSLVSSYLDEDRVDEALPLLEELSSSLEPAEESLKPLIESTLGALYEEKGDIQKALTFYRSALQLIRNGPLTPGSQSFQAELLSSIGRVNFSQGNRQEAKKAYEELLMIAPSGYRAYATQIKLADLREPEPAALPTEGAAPTAEGGEEQLSPEAAVDASASVTEPTLDTSADLAAPAAEAIEPTLAAPVADEALAASPPADAGQASEGLSPETTKPE